MDNCTSGNDTIYLTEGTYWQSVAISGKDGIYLSSADALAPATLSGSGVEGLNMITIENSNSICIVNLIIREKFLQDANAICVVGEGDGIYIIDNEIFNIGWTDDSEADPEVAAPVGKAHAILINGRTENGLRAVYIGRNYFHNIVAGNGECLTLTGNTYDFLIEDNLIEDVTNIGIDIAGHFSWAFPVELDQSLNQSRSGRIKTNTVKRCRRPTAGNEPAGIYADGGKDVIIDNNRVYDNGTGISFACENFEVTASGMKVVNNLIYNNDKFGAVFSANAGLVENSVFRNNTLFNNGVFFDNSGSIALQKSASSSILNNIIYLTSEDYFGLSLFGFVVSDLEINHNIFFSPDGSTPRVFAFNPGVGSGSSADDPIFEDPLFASAEEAAPDFHLLEGSPAIDAGTQNVELVPDERDMDGILRVLENIDMGAFEAQTLVGLTDRKHAEVDIFQIPVR
ncbi:MAG: hypothetical protein ACJAZC_002154 [Cryomorphaceae bacterium]